MSALEKDGTSEHTLKVAGEVQMKALSHDMGLIRRENERLTAERDHLKDCCTRQAHEIIRRTEEMDALRERERELVEALKLIPPLILLLKSEGFAPEYTRRIDDLVHVLLRKVQS